MLSEELPETTPLGYRLIGPMHLAAWKGGKDVLKKLHEHGFSIDALSDQENRPPIAYAIESGNVETFRYLVEAGAATKDIVSTYNPPLFWQALATGNRDMIEAVAKATSQQPLSDLIEASVRTTREGGMIEAHRVAVELVEGKK